MPTPGQHAALPAQSDAHAPPQPALRCPSYPSEPTPRHCKSRWQEGNCRFGNRCNFAHGEAELRGLPPRSRGPSGGPYSQVGPGAGPGTWQGHQQTHGPGSNSSSGTPAADHAAKPEKMTDREVWVASGCPVAGPNGWTQYQVNIVVGWGPAPVCCLIPLPIEVAMQGPRLLLSGQPPGPQDFLGTASLSSKWAVTCLFTRCPAPFLHDHRRRPTASTTSTTENGTRRSGIRPPGGQARHEVPVACPSLVGDVVEDVNGPVRLDQHGC